MKFLGILFASICSSLFCQAQNLWQATTQDAPFYGQQLLHPEHYQLYQFNSMEWQSFQASIPATFAKNKIIQLPNPDGELQDFYIYEHSMMHPALAVKYPSINTYTAISKNDASITAKVDFTNYGFHAMVYDAEKTYCVDPISDLDKTIYIAYYKKDLSRPLHLQMQCLAEDNAIGNNGDHNPTQTSNKTGGTLIRNYRLALACTGEYAVAVAGANPSKANVLSKMVTSMNRVNGIYEKEFSVHLNLIANNDTLIKLDTADGYTNSSGAAMLNQNQTIVNNLVGSTNYDIGHVFSTGGGGIATLASVCGNSKARGVTGLPVPLGDPFDVDYVCHEMGHQFNGSHIFDAETGSCNGNRSSNNAYEVGSGSTIMGYAGLCPQNDLQSNSDDYFSIRSLNTISGFLEGNGGACATTVNSNNTPPSIPAIQKTYYIPYLTFFEVDQQALDADGDTIKYCWEQYNRNTTGINWNDPTVRNPLFRTFYPTTSNQRVFPKMANCLLHTVKKLGERCPDTNRVVTLKLAVRDVHNGYGAFNYTEDSIVINSRMSPALFRITSQTTAVQYNGFDNINVTWDVAGTDTMQNILTKKVNIWLSTDGGLTWPHLIGNAVNNSGSAMVTLPNIATTTARLKVKADENIYFDVNTSKFTIKYRTVGVGIGNTLLHDITFAQNAESLTLKNITIPSDVTIISSAGALVASQKIDGNNNSVNIAQLRAGVYVLRVANSNGYITHKFVQP